MDKYGGDIFLVQIDVIESKISSNSNKENSDIKNEIELAQSGVNLVWETNELFEAHAPNFNVEAAGFTAFHSKIILVAVEL